MRKKIIVTDENTLFDQIRSVENFAKFFCTSYDNAIIYANTYHVPFSTMFVVDDDLDKVFPLAIFTIDIVSFHFRVSFFLPPQNFLSN